MGLLSFCLYLQWMNTRTLVTIDTKEKMHVIDVRSEEELEVGCLHECRCQFFRPPNMSTVMK